MPTVAQPQKIVIGFDATPLARQQASGIDHYTRGLITALATQYPSQLELVGHYFNFLGRSSASKLPEASNITYRQTRWLPHQVFTMLRRIGLPIPFEFLLRSPADFYLFPNFIGWPSIKRKPSAVVIHDLYYHEHPEQVRRLNRYDLTKLVPKTLRRSSLVITISKATSAALQQAYPTITKPTVITPIPPEPPLKLSPKEATTAVQNLGITKPYILFVGTIEPRKNIIGLLNAYALLPTALRQKYALVLAGGKGWLDEPTLQLIASLQAQGESIVQTGYIDNATKAALYHQATLFVLPSFYEGFGIPILEALSYEVPVLISDIPVFREVAGKAANYCDPHEPADIASKLEQLLADSDLPAKTKLLAQQQLQKFSWSKSASDVFEAIAKQVKR